MELIRKIKQRFGIIGNSEHLNRSIELAIRVANTDLSVLISGESGSGKEFFPRIIHENSARKHKKYIAVNCGAIPEGTIDSELFGHIKGSFTGAHTDRKGYFEEANEGTIFLDEVGELPLSTQVRLLRVLEAGEFLKVGSSAVQKTDVRVVAATNVDLPHAINEGRFREDLYYRLNTVNIKIVSLRERQDDIPMLFRHFASEFAAKHRMPVIKLTDEAAALLKRYPFPGNIRQLKNLAEQISVVEQNRTIEEKRLSELLSDYGHNLNLPVLASPKAAKAQGDTSFATEREILYKILFDLKRDMNEMKQIVADRTTHKDGEHPPPIQVSEEQSKWLQQSEHTLEISPSLANRPPESFSQINREEMEDIEENLSLLDNEKELIIKALKKYDHKRKKAAQELGFSERTLYRKLKKHGLE